MAFCTNCGAEVSGPFCGKCGAPAPGAMPAQGSTAPAGGVPAGGGTPPPPYSAPPTTPAAAAAKNSPLIWILAGCGGLIVLWMILCGDFTDFAGPKGRPFWRNTAPAGTK